MTDTPETKHERSCAYVTSDGPAPCTCKAGLAAAAARASFEEDHRLGERSWGKGRHSSIPKSHGVESRNYVD